MADRFGRTNFNSEKSIEMALNRRNGLSDISNLPKINPSVKRRRVSIAEDKLHRDAKFKNRPKRPITHQLGYFGFIPQEIQHKIFHLLSAHGLVKFAKCGKTCNQLVLQFLQTQPVVMKLFMSCIDHVYPNGVNPIKCQQLGYVLQSVIAPYPLNDAVKVAVNICKMIREEIRADKLKLNLRKCETALGYILKVVITRHNFEAQWLQKLVLAVETEATNLGYNLCMAWNSDIDIENQPAQLQIRNFYRRLFLDAQDSWADRIKILKVILDLRESVKHKANMIFVIYGPTLNDAAVWNLLPQIDLMPANVIKILLQDFGSCLTALHNHAPTTTTTDNSFILHIIQEITKLPSQWLPENKAMLLVVSGEKIVDAYMKNNARTIVEQAMKGDTTVQIHRMLNSLAHFTLKLVAANCTYTIQRTKVRMQNILMSILETLAPLKEHHHVFLDALGYTALMNYHDAVQGFGGSILNREMTWKVLQFQYAFTAMLWRKSPPRI